MLIQYVTFQCLGSQGLFAAEPMRLKTAKSQAALARFLTMMFTLIDWE